jgi:UDP-GlcNAc:undecaprenyl-phosphate/decaprenyl-phosphate GlcNAc-1-phosphate transferase
VTSVLTAVFATVLAAVICMGLLRRPTLSAFPTPDRWHGQATPVTGGIAIFLAFLISLQPALFSGAIASPYLPVILGVAGAWVLGFLDDVYQLSPRSKLAGQVLIACGAVAAGLYPDWVDVKIGAPLSVIVLVAAMNSLNLLDHIDGLAAGTAMIAALCLALIAGGIGSSGSSVVPAAIAGACAGYLPFNYRWKRPAAIFMGDSGSHVLGFGLGGAALLASRPGAGSVVSAVAVPVLVLAVPLLDTGLVTIVRWVERRPISQGGRDHSSHRLVYGGLSQKSAVATLLAISAVCGGAAVLLAARDDPRPLAAAAVITVLLLFAFGALLARLEEGGESSVLPFRRRDEPEGDAMSDGDAAAR